LIDAGFDEEITFMYLQQGMGMIYTESSSGFVETA